MRAAVIQGEDVLNVIEVESLDQQDEFRELGMIPADAILVETDEAGPGWTYADGVFTPPPEPAPDPDQVVRDNITNAPTNLTGGPTIAEVFNVNN
jgi:hypothetical protein